MQNSAKLQEEISIAGHVQEKVIFSIIIIIIIIAIIITNESTGISIFTWFFVRINIHNLLFETTIYIKQKETFLIDFRLQFLVT